MGEPDAIDAPPKDVPEGATDLLSEYLQSRGTGREIWSSNEAKDFLASLRSRPDDET